MYLTKLGSTIVLLRHDMFYMFQNLVYASDASGLQVIRGNFLIS